MTSSKNPIYSSNMSEAAIECSQIYAGNVRAIKRDYLWSGNPQRRVTDYTMRLDLTDLALGMVGLGMLGVLGSAVINAIHSWSWSYFVTLPGFLILLGFVIQLLSRNATLKKNTILTAERLASVTEPRGLWNRKYPQVGERGMWVHAVLGARTLLNLVAEYTTLSVDMKAIDARAEAAVIQISHLDEQIDAYLTQEINDFCTLAHTFFHQWQPIISLQIDVAEIGIKTESERKNASTLKKNK